MKAQVKSIDIKNCALTIGNCYSIIEVKEDKYKLINDLGKACWYSQTYFKVCGGKKIKPLIAKKKHWKDKPLTFELWLEKFTGIPKDKLKIISFKTGKEVKI